MPIVTRHFEAWLETVNLPTSSTELSRLVRMPRRTLANQRGRGRLDPAVIVAIARAGGLSPYDALAATSALTVMTHRRPTTAPEILSQTTADDVFAELLRRTRESYAQALTAVALSSLPIPDGVRQWINAVDSGNIRTAVADRVGVDPSTLSAAITNNRISLNVNAHVADLTGTDPATGLVAMGLITMAEAGWPADARHLTLAQLDDIDLLHLSSIRLTDLQRRVARHLNVQADDNRYWEILG